MKSLALVLVLASRVVLAQSAEPNTWRYEATIDGTPWSVTKWEGGNEVFAGVPAFFHETITISADGDKRIDERAYSEKTPKGIAALGTRTAQEIGGATTTEERVALLPPVELPAPLDVGAKWEATTSLRATPVASTATLHVVGEAIGREGITVPAGTFDCIVVRDTATTQTTVNTATTEEVAVTTSWYAPKVGLVKATTTTTITTTRGTDTSRRETTRSLALQAYRVPRPPWQMSSVGLVPPGEPAPSEPAPTAPVPAAQPPVTAPPPQPAQPETAPAPIDDKNEKHRRLGRRLVITGGLVLVVSGALGVLAHNEWNTAQGDCGGNIKNCTAAQLGQAQIDTDAARGYANFATGFFVIGGGLAAVGAYLWLGTPSEDKPAVKVQPTVTPTTATIMLSGSW